jgi:hypothetical protein
MTIIRDINGNRTKHSLRHFMNNSAECGAYHTDSTGLFIVDYPDQKGNMFQAFIRPESVIERNAIRLAMRIGKERE